MNDSISEPLKSNLDDSDIYAALINYARDNEMLIYSNTSTYVAIMLPLFGVAIGAGDFGNTVQLFAAGAGIIVSVIWYLVIERSRRWFTHILNLTAEMERNSGYLKGRSTLYSNLPLDDFFIKMTPRSSRMFSMMYVLGIVLFLAVFLHLASRFL